MATAVNRSLTSCGNSREHVNDSCGNSSKQITDDVTQLSITVRPPTRAPGWWLCSTCEVTQLSITVRPPHVLHDGGCVLQVTSHSCQSQSGPPHVLQDCGCVLHVTSHSWHKSSVCIARHVPRGGKFKSSFMLYALIQYITYLATPSFERASIICH